MVADSCTDGTVDVARAFTDDVLEVSVRDKGSAMAAGLRAVTSRNVLFCDADLSGLLADHVSALLNHPPEHAMIVGLRDGHPVGLGALPPISGERRVPTQLASEAALEGSGWKAELRLNAAASIAGLPWAHLVLRGVTNPARPKLVERAQLAAAAAGYGRHLWRYAAAGRRVRPGPFSGR